MEIRAYNNFALDLDKISNRSAAADKIRLPYTGELPDGITTVEVGFTMTAQLDCNVVLHLTDTDGKEHKRPVDTNAEEIGAVLDRFFDVEKSGRPKNSGLDDYWMGVNMGLYMAWAQSYGLRGVRRDYTRKIILRLTDKIMIMEKTA